MTIIITINNESRGNIISTRLLLILLPRGVSWIMLPSLSFLNQSCCFPPLGLCTCSLFCLELSSLPRSILLIFWVLAKASPPHFRSLGPQTCSDSSCCMLSNPLTFHLVALITIIIKIINRLLIIVKVSFPCLDGSLSLSKLLYPWQLVQTLTYVAAQQVSADKGNTWIKQL